MHIDHAKLIELISEASGMEPENVEKQLSELIQEIQNAIKEGDAYEVEGFGIFSGLGNNIIFIPSEELSTEINYKYVGMEPIELDAPATDPEEVNALETRPEKASAEEMDDDPFAGLLDEIIDEEESEAPAPLDLDAELEEESEEEIAAESEPVVAEESKGTDTEEELDDTEFDAVFGTADESEAKPGPESWGIDAYRDEHTDKAFSGLMGITTDDEKEEASTKEDEITSEEMPATEPKLRIQLDEEQATAETEQPETEEIAEEKAFADDEDDPFKGLHDDEAEEGKAEEPAHQEVDHAEELIPVITNISSGSGEKEPARVSGPRQKSRRPSDRKKSPVMLWILTFVIVTGASLYGLDYFGIINLTQLNGMLAGNQTTQATATSPMPDALLPQEEPETVAQVEEPEQFSSETVAEETPVPALPSYGLHGELSPAVTDGYTIVLFSLRRQSSAENQRRVLTRAGFRALVFPIPHSQYGTLYRVSVGQFESLRDAALAAEKLSSPYRESYFITKIQPD